MTQYPNFDELLALKDGWNSYKAKAIDSATANQAKAVIDQVLGSLGGKPVPDLVPLVDGGIEAAWHLKGSSLEIEFRPGQKPSLLYAEDGLNTNLLPVIIRLLSDMSQR